MNKRMDFPEIGEFYRDDAGDLYQIIALAKDAFTLEEQVVYQKLSGAFERYTMPAKVFLGEVASASGVSFQKIELGEEDDVSVRTDYVKGVEMTSDTTYHTTPCIQKNGREEEQLEQLFINFLDAESSKDKLELIQKMKPNLTVRIVNNIAASMDLPADEDDIERQYDFIVQNLKHRSKFECDRFRG